MAWFEVLRSSLYLILGTHIHSHTSSDRHLCCNVCILGNTRTEESFSVRDSESSQWALTFSSEEPAITADYSAHLNGWKWRAIG